MTVKSQLTIVRHTTTDVDNLLTLEFSPLHHLSQHRRRRSSSSRTLQFSKSCLGPSPPPGIHTHLFSSISHKIPRKSNSDPGPLLYPQTPPPRRRRRHPHLPRPHQVEPHRPRRPQQDHLARQTCPGPLPLPPAHLALYRRRFLLQRVLRAPLCGRG